MAIDASIPLQVKQFNLSDVMADAQQMRMREAQMRHYDAQAREADDKRRRDSEKNSALSDLIATRGPNGFDTTGDAFKRYTQAAPQDAFEMIGKLDERKRKEVEAGVKDMAAAVQWADTPQKWAVVQQHYGKYDPQLGAIPFEAREQSLLQLGQMGEYLEKTAPKIMSFEAGGGIGAVDPRTGRPTFTVIPNPGDQPMGAPVQGGGVREGATATNPQTGQKIMFQGGRWVPVAGGQTARPSGTFRPVGLAGETITSTYRTPEHNKRVGGVNNSFHTRRGLDGKPLARDSVPPRGMSMATYAAELRRLNPHLDVINEGDHVHLEPRG